MTLARDLSAEEAIGVRRTRARGEVGLVLVRASFLVFWVAILGVVGLRAQPTSAGGQNSKLQIMPLPASPQWMEGRLALDEKFSISIAGYSDARLERGVQRTLRKLSARTGITLPVRSETKSAATLVVQAGSGGLAVQGLREDESYTLDIQSQQAVLHATTVVGALRGLQTLQQLLVADEHGFYFPGLHIEDRPRFAWRGLLVDVSRHWESVEVIKRILDSMEVVKLNVFHWHLSDDQGFRVESKQFPLLHKAGSGGLYYTQAEIRDVVAYARERGIRVVPEFDMPGHAHAWFIGYPQFASAPGPYEFKRYIGGDSIPFDPTKEATYRFINAFVGEMASLFPDAYWHVGGDEIDGTPWDKNAAIQAFMKSHGLKTNESLQVYFNRRLMKILRKHGKQMVGWDEILNPELPKDAVIQSWRGSESLAEAAKQGYNGILSAPYYLDKMFRTSVYYAGDPLPTGNDLNAEQAGHVLGGEACAWGELIDEENIESRIWPYAAAIAERLWSPREVKDAADMYRRLDIVTHRLEEAGSRHLTNPAAMLRRAAGGEVPEQARDFMDLMEPLRQGMRMDERRPTQPTPLSELGDIVVADPPGAREFTAQVDDFLADAPVHAAYRTSLHGKFAEWRAMKPTIDSLASRAPVFRDAQATAADLANLGTAGEEAMDLLTSGAKPPAGWMERERALLETASKPKGLLKIAILDAVRKLIEACGTI